MNSLLNNRYRLDRQIGEGGFARVFLATDLELGRQVAVKVLDQSWVADKELMIRFRNEARAIAALDHPHILQIFDFGVVNGTPYIVMPYISGGTLDERMKQGAFTFDEIGNYLDQISSALDYAHERGIVHRDVKPSNLLMRANGQLVLMDFGLAKLLEKGTSEASTGVMGTVAYMAPEQFLGFVSKATDVYMLGIIFYQMLVGKLPFAGNTSQVIDAHLHAMPPTLAGQTITRGVSPLVVQALDRVITKVLAKAPADRYTTCQGLYSAFYQALKVDPDKPARFYNREAKLDARRLDGTIIERAGLPALPRQQARTPVPSSLETTIIEPSNQVFELPAGAITEKDLDATLVAPHPLRRKKVATPAAHLLVTTEPERIFQARFDLVGEAHSLGRAKNNDLHVPLPIISRYHAAFHRLTLSDEKSTYKIVMKQSSNSLYFQGKKVTERVLENGDVIEIGQRGYAEYIVKLIYHAAE